MSAKAIDYKIILKRDGQTQQERMPQWLDPALVPIDDRTKEDFFNYLKSISKEIKFFGLDNKENGTWEDFFNLDFATFNALTETASLPTHLALWNAFIELYRKPQDLMNTITKKHLDFFYGEVLKLSAASEIADKAHVLFELKKNTANTLLVQNTPLLAGKDKLKKDLHYVLTHDIIVNTSKVEQLKSLFIDPANKNFLHAAPIANSADGTGAALDKTNPKWNAFGNVLMPPAQIGFCLSSPVLKMQEGSRTINVTLTIDNLSANAKNSNYTNGLFNVTVTGEKGWLGPKSVSPSVTTSDNKRFTLSFSFELTKDEPAVTAYNAAVHGLDFDTKNPLMQILINPKSSFGYKDLLSAELVDATIEVVVAGMQDLQLENDFGTINPKKPFALFGPSPEANSNFSVGCDEAFSKRLKEFSLDVSWKNIPATNLATYYSGYEGSHANNSFTAYAQFKDGAGWQGSQNSVNLFNSINASASMQWRFTNDAFIPRITYVNIADLRVLNVKSAGETATSKLTRSFGLLSPSFKSLQVKTVRPVAFYPILLNLIQDYKDLRKGMLNLRLNQSFLFKEYRKSYTQAVLADPKTPTLPNEPFSPEAQSLQFNYTATTAKTAFSGTNLTDYIDQEIEFFQYGAFGQMREHAYNRSQHAFLTNNLVKIVPQYYNEGEFFVGLSGLRSEDSVCILLQVADGSANPDKKKVDINWSVLCDNYWKDLSKEDFIFDTTNSLLTSGVIKIVIPPEATTENTIMPNGLLWLKAAIANDSDAVCNVTDVQSNAAIVQFQNQGNELSHLDAALPANTINKLQNEIAAIKSVKQPYASFGGRAKESDTNYYIRVCERLRHKERAIALWDYERLILQAFPGIHKVKCINHASEDSFYDPGNTLIVVVPDLTNKNAVNPFQPKVDKNTLDEVYTFLNAHSSSWVMHHVRNPFYELVKIFVRIKLKIGFEFNYYEKIIDQALQQFLCPWLNNKSDIHFGGKVTKSQIIKFLEDLEYVDFITDLKLFQSTDAGVSFGSDKEFAETSNPAAILVSVDHHEIINS